MQVIPGSAADIKAIGGGGGAALQAALAQPDYVNDMTPAIGLVSWQAPLLFAAKSAHASGDAFKKLPEAIGLARIASKKVIMDKHRQDNAEPTAVVRIQAEGSAADTVEQVHWVPQALKDSASAPERLGTFGAPWLMSGTPGSSRVAPTHYMFPGAGHCLHQLDGSVLVIVWPLAPGVAKGACAYDEATWFGALGLKDFYQFATEHFSHCLLHPGDTVWVPWGYHAAIVCPVTGADVANTVYVPWWSATLLQQADTAVAEAVLASLMAWVTDSLVPAVIRDRDAILKWMTASNPTGKEIKASVIPAIADAGDEDEEEEEDGEEGDDEEAPDANSALGEDAQVEPAKGTSTSAGADTSCPDTIVV